MYWDWDQTAVYCSMHRNQSWEQVVEVIRSHSELVGFLLVYISAEFVVGRVNLGLSIHCFDYEMGLVIELTRWLQPPVCVG